MLLSFRGHRILGPLVNTFFSMLHDIAKFSLLYLIIFMIFVFVSSISMVENEGFNDVWKSIKSIFMISMGQFDFDAFTNVKMVKEWFISLFIFILIAILNITLLNFVIAILSNTYEKLQSLSLSVYLKFIISQRILTGPHPTYSAFISACPGLNLLVLPLAPLLFCCRSRRLNQIILFFEFLPFMILGVMLYIL